MKNYNSKVMFDNGNVINIEFKSTEVDLEKFKEIIREVYRTGAEGYIEISKTIINVPKTVSITIQEV